MSQPKKKKPDTESAEEAQQIRQIKHSLAGPDTGYGCRFRCRDGNGSSSNAMAADIGRDEGQHVKERNAKQNVMCNTTQHRSKQQ